ncbi:MAG: hypothetical protein H0X29_00405 [Parachlamydiaceae bacterium]|nr:hypothetical protein [Parachlamydiaceae bacterium]
MISNNMFTTVHKSPLLSQNACHEGQVNKTAGRVTSSPSFKNFNFMKIAFLVPLFFSVPAEAASQQFSENNSLKSRASFFDNFNTSQELFSAPTITIVKGPCEKVEAVEWDEAPYLIEGNTFIDCRSLSRQIADRTRAMVNEINFVSRGVKSRIADKLGYPNDYITPSADGNYWKKDNEGLYVLIHGLDGHPSMWDGHAKSLKERHPNAEVRQPYVLQKGQTSLKNAAKPISDMVRNYLASHTGHPVTLIGVSNGGRIAGFIEYDLRDTPSTIKVSNIAGVHFGTGIVNVLNQLGISRFVMSEPIREEMPYGSQTAQELLDAEREPLDPGIKRDFEFYATTEDSRLWPYSVALPILGQGERHYIVHGEEHSSIIDRVRDHQLDNAVLWMSRHKVIS